MRDAKLCLKCGSKMLFQDASYENFNGCRTYTCASAFRKSGECYFQSQLCKERESHNQRKRELAEAREALEYIAHAGLSARHIEDYAREFLKRKEAAK